MKSFIFTLLTMSALGACICTAEVLTPDEALQRLRSDGAATQALRSAQSALAKSAAANAGRAQGCAAVKGTEGSSLLLTVRETPSKEAALYLFGQGNDGVLVVSADDQAAPLLGVMDRAALATDIKADAPLSLESMPPSLQWWLQEYARQIEWARENPLSQAPPLTITGATATSAARAAASQRQEIAPMSSTQWNQSAPYNNMCPKISGKTSVTGCVATAEAQVLKTHNWPVAGEGSISYTDSYNHTYSMDFSAATFDWDNMLDIYNAGNYTSAQGSAVALLMKACGYASEMNYSPNESGASMATARAGLVKYFQYAEAEHLNRNYYPLSEWEDILYGDLAQGLCCMYGGATPDGSGHCFVADGYSSDGFFHFNWGWGGAYDGYFKLTALNPEGFGIGGASGGFNYSQEIIHRIIPGNSSADVPSAGGDFNLLGNLTCSNTSQSSGMKGIKMAASGSSAYNTTGFFNMSGMEVTIDIGVAFEDASGNVKVSSAGSSKTIKYGSGYASYTCSYPFGLANGTYTVYPVYRPSDSTEWLRTRAALGYCGEATVTKSGSLYTVTNGKQLFPSITEPTFISPLYSGHNCQFSTQVTNPAGKTEFYGEIIPFVFQLSGGQLQQVGQLGDSPAVNLLPGESQTVTFTGPFMAVDTDGNSTDLGAGSYYLVFGWGAAGEVLTDAQGTQVFPFTLQSNPGSSALSLKSFTIQGDRNAANPTDLHFDFTVYNSNGYYSNSVILVIFEYDTDDMESVTEVYSDPLFLAGGESKDVALKAAIPDPVDGMRYLAAVYNASTNRPIGTRQIIFTVKSPESGIDGVEADSAGEADSAAVYYNLQGAQVSAGQQPQAPGLYIRRNADGQTAKILVK